MIRAHGPWPLKPPPDPSNRFSGNQTAIAFGKDLFSDPRLSRDGNLSCTSCHVPELGFTDGLERSTGIGEVDRNAPAIANLANFRWFGWDGRSDTLWGQSIHPILNDLEMAATAADIATQMVGQEDLSVRYEQATKTNPAYETPEALLVNTGKILAAYQETLRTPRTHFDDYRDALVTGDTAGQVAYPDAAKRGLKIFTGKGKCSICHFGPLFTNGEFHSIGIKHFAAADRVDTGRYGGLKAFRESKLNRLGPYSDEDQALAAKAPSAYAAFLHSNWGAYRVPSLRNVGATAPYMHDGSLATLEDVVDHYSDMNMDRLHSDGETLLRPLDLSKRERADLVAFLHTLTAAPVAHAAGD
ncbi:cytochrome c peroxidase [Roseibium polysiphoniae]|uniref:cytochrome-c peroxidase n=1 Tax=Roseibium polysiphoniae TaxID=2571221 RepID=UPI003298AADA